MSRPPTTSRDWTSIDRYWQSFALRRTARRKREGRPRSPPAETGLALSTLPFLALAAGLAVLAVAIFTLAWPGGHKRPRGGEAAAPSELGTAPPGWLEPASAPAPGREQRR